MKSHGRAAPEPELMDKGSTGGSIKVEAGK
jgi:hypothetical protein